MSATNNAEKEAVNEMLQLYHHFVRTVDQIRQYNDVNIQDTLWDFIPVTIKNRETSREKAIALAKWVTDFMEWDDSPALPRRTNVLEVFDRARGRCGEYANVLCALLKTMKFQARLIFDFTDHVWVEWYDDQQEIWLPLDATLDNPELTRYARSLSGKEISYIIAFESQCLKDVTFEYVPDEHKEEVKKRRTNPFVDVLIEMYNLGAEREDWE